MSSLVTINIGGDKYNLYLDCLQGVFSINHNILIGNTSVTIVIEDNVNLNVTNNDDVLDKLSSLGQVDDLYISYSNTELIRFVDNIEISVSKVTTGRMITFSENTHHVFFENLRKRFVESNKISDVNGNYDRFIKNTLYITKRCNLQCPFCSERHIDSVDFTYQSIEMSLAMIIDSLTDKRNLVCFTIIGGEPFVNKDRFMYVLNRLKSYDLSNVILKIYTNGLIYDDCINDLIDECDFKDILWVISTDSLDINKSIRYFSQSEIDRFKSSLSKYMSRFGNEKVQIVSVYSDSPKQIYDTIDILYDEYGVREFLIDKDNFKVGVDNVDMYVDEYNNMVDYLINKYPDINITEEPFFEVILFSLVDGDGRVIKQKVPIMIDGSMNKAVSLVYKPKLDLYMRHKINDVYDKYIDLRKYMR
ncbi:MAG: radical SAM protein [Peptostreptococcaceae bacterium]